MGSEPMNRGDQLVEPEAGPDLGPVQGVCSTCGRALPEPDLEAVAADVDHRLSLEFGQLVARSAWAGKPPDGLLDGLLGWMPAMRTKRTIWERGQALWAQLMTEALTGPCEDCRELAPDQVEPSATIIQPRDRLGDIGTHDTEPGVIASTDVKTSPGVQSLAAPPPPPAVESATVAIPLASAHATPAAPEAEDAATRAIDLGPRPSSSTPASPAADVGAPVSPPPPATSPPAEPAAPASTGPADTTPASTEGSASADHAAIDPEYEAHTVMIPALPRETPGAMLVVLEGPVHGRQFSVERTTTTIGRSIGCHITIEADRLGYEHARVVRDENSWRLEVTAGAGDTYVNDEPVKGRRPLRSGDIVRIGPARLRFEAPG